MLLNKIAGDYLAESVTLNRKFEEISRYATKWPETTKEHLEMQSFLINADQTTLLELNNKILSLKEIWHYLLEEHYFSDADLDTNLRALTWTSQMPLLFDKAQDTLDEARTFHDNALTSKKEAVEAELDSIINRVDEFNDFDDIAQMKQYTKEVRKVLWRLQVVYIKGEPRGENGTTDGRTVRLTQWKDR